MRWLVALLGLLVVLCAGTLLAVVLIERDPTGEELRACTEDAGARRIDGADSLGPLRVDLLADTLSASRPQTLANGYRATYLRPEDGSYLAVAVARDDQGDLDMIEMVRTEPSVLPIVAYAQGERAAALEACVDEQR